MVSIPGLYSGSTGSYCHKQLFIAW